MYFQLDFNCLHIPGVFRPQHSSLKSVNLSTLAFFAFIVKRTQDWKWRKIEAWRCPTLLWRQLLSRKRKCEKEKWVDMRKTNKQKAAEEKRKKKDKDSLYHSNNIIITGDEASRLQVGNISICVLRWTIILWFNGRLFSGTLFGFTNSRHLNVLDFCIKATIFFLLSKT